MGLLDRKDRLELRWQERGMRNLLMIQFGAFLAVVTWYCIYKEINPLDLSRGKQLKILTAAAWASVYFAPMFLWRSGVWLDRSRGRVTSWWGFRLPGLFSIPIFFRHKPLQLFKEVTYRTNIGADRGTTVGGTPGSPNQMLSGGYVYTVMLWHMDEEDGGLQACVDLFRTWRQPRARSTAKTVSECLSLPFREEIDDDRDIVFAPDEPVGARFQALLAERAASDQEGPSSPKECRIQIDKGTDSLTVHLSSAPIDISLKIFACLTLLPMSCRIWFRLTSDIHSWAVDFWLALLVVIGATPLAMAWLRRDRIHVRNGRIVLEKRVFGFLPFRTKIPFHEIDYLEIVGFTHDHIQSKGACIRTVGLHACTDFGRGLTDDELMYLRELLLWEIAANNEIQPTCRDTTPLSV
ncbi:MAG: hypothetical protein OEM02_05360 [Desulfobulbaceae bacterium]|nr:hypothetical protein [Desulfobulbaceae bacterium]